MGESQVVGIEDRVSKHQAISTVSQELSDKHNNGNKRSFV